MSTILTNPVAKIGDVIRGSLLVDRPEHIRFLCQKIAFWVIAEGGKFYIKNFWAEPQRLSLGYVGVHMKMRMPIPPEKRRYILLELQLHVKAIMDGTKDCAKEIAHRLYKAPKEAGVEPIPSEIISCSQLVYLTAMTRLLSKKEALEKADNTVQLFQAMNKAEKQKGLVMATALLLQNSNVGFGRWSDGLQAVVPLDRDAVATAWMETAKEINRKINLPDARMDERDDWTNTAASVHEIYQDAAKIRPFFETLCNKAAQSQPGCSVNFGPIDEETQTDCMIKKRDSLLEKIQADQEEELRRFFTHELLPKIRRTWAQITESNSVPFGRFSQLQNLNFSGCSQMEDGDLRFLGCLPAIQTLSLARCYRITDRGLAHLEHLTGLRSLNLSGCSGITEVGLGHLWRLTAFQNLNFDGSKITEAGYDRWLLSRNLIRVLPQQLQYAQIIKMERQFNFGLAVGLGVSLLDLAIALGALKEGLFKSSRSKVLDYSFLNQCYFLILSPLMRGIVEGMYSKFFCNSLRNEVQKKHPGPEGMLMLKKLNCMLVLMRVCGAVLQEESEFHCFYPGRIMPALKDIFSGLLAQDEIGGIPGVIGAVFTHNFIFSIFSRIIWGNKNLSK